MAHEHDEIEICEFCSCYDDLREVEFQSANYEYETAMICQDCYLEDEYTYNLTGDDWDDDEEDEEDEEEEETEEEKNKKYFENMEKEIERLGESAYYAQFGL